MYLRDVWPTTDEIQEVLESSVKSDIFRETYARVFTGDEDWRALPGPAEGPLTQWDESSAYVQEPPFFRGHAPSSPAPIQQSYRWSACCCIARRLDYDRPHFAGGPIERDGTAGQYLTGARHGSRSTSTAMAPRGNHQVMMRGTFANVRLRNAITPAREGDWTIRFPTGEEMRVFDASRRYVTGRHAYDRDRRQGVRIGKLAIGPRRGRCSLV